MRGVWMGEVWMGVIAWVDVGQPPARGCVFYANIRPINRIGPTSAIAEPFPNGSLYTESQTTTCRKTTNPESNNRFIPAQCTLTHQKYVLQTLSEF